MFRIIRYITMPEDPAKHYFSRNAAIRYQSYWERAFSDAEGASRERERFRRFAGPLKAGAHILDAGCGTGLGDGYFIRGGYEVTGIDYSEEMLEIASRTNPGVSYSRMDVRRLNFPDSTFDGIWNSAVAVHIPWGEFAVVAGEFSRVLKEGGRLFLATRVSREARYAVEESAEGGRMQVFYYTPRMLLSDLEEYGFVIEYQEIVPDDSGRPFDYIYIYAEKSSGRK